MANGYAHASHASYDDYYDDYRSYPSHDDFGIVSLLLVAAIGYIVYLVFFKKSGSGALDDRDFEAFKKVEELRAEIKKAQELVNPSAKPSYSATIAINVPKPPDSEKK